MLLSQDPARAFMPYPPVPVANVPEGPLSGLTFAVKDLFDVAGYRTGCGNPVRLAQSAVASRHAPPVQALLDAGARFVGKAHTEELAWSLYGTNAHFGTPLNPAAPDRVPGGSSSGSASAVAAGLCDIALGSDTGGSVRAPASFCGLYGLRPTFGAIALDACMPLAPSFDTCGFFARDLATFGRMASVLLPADTADLSSAHLMIASDLFARLPANSRTVLAARLAAIAAISGEPAPAVVYPGAQAPIYDAFRKLQSHEIYQVHGAWFEQQKPVLGPPIAERFAYARTVTDVQAAEARAIRTGFAEGFRALLGTRGVLVSPVVHGPAPRLDDSAQALDAYRHEAMAFLCPAGLSGLPQLVVPAGMVEGAPIGLSLIGPAGSDRQLIALAARLGL
ncbi:MAG: amidase [Beijerinckiaceae bacterium]|jgi:amidase|nr:amidase [Beijerinckiaceae bacterium]